jgi:Flp pilus assembly pilin Flp
MRLRSRASSRHPAERKARDGGIETLEVALIGALFTVIILASIPFLTGGIQGAFELVSERIVEALN